MTTDPAALNRLASKLLELHLLLSILVDKEDVYLIDLARRIDGARHYCQNHAALLSARPGELVEAIAKTCED